MRISNATSIPQRNARNPVKAVDISQPGIKGTLTGVYDDAVNIYKETFQESFGNIKTTAKGMGKAVVGMIAMAAGAVGAYFFKDNQTLANYGSIGVAIAGLGVLISGFVGLNKKPEMPNVEAPIPKEKLQNGEKVKTSEADVIKHDSDFTKPISSSNNSKILKNEVGSDPAFTLALKQYAVELIDEANKVQTLNYEANDDRIYTNASKDEIKLSTLRDRLACALGALVASGADVASDPSLNKIFETGERSIKDDYSNLLPKSFLKSSFFAAWYATNLCGKNDSLNLDLGGVDAIARLESDVEALGKGSSTINENDVFTQLRKLQNHQNYLQSLRETIIYVVDFNPDAGDKDAERTRVLLRQGLVFGLNLQGNNNEEIDDFLRSMLKNSGTTLGIDAKLEQINKLFNEDGKVKKAFESEQFPFERIDGTIGDDHVLTDGLKFCEIKKKSIKPTSSL